MTANGQLAFSGDAAVVAAGAALELSEQTISVRCFGLSRSSTHTGAWSLAPSFAARLAVDTDSRRSASAGLSRTWSMRRPRQCPLQGLGGPLLI